MRIQRIQGYLIKLGKKLPENSSLLQASPITFLTYFSICLFTFLQFLPLKSLLNPFFFSIEGVKQGKIWQLLTYALFMRGSLFSILLFLLAFTFIVLKFLTQLEQKKGSLKFLLYTISFTLIGSLSAFFFYLLFPLPFALDASLLLWALFYFLTLESTPQSAWLVFVLALLHNLFPFSLPGLIASCASLLLAQVFHRFPSLSFKRVKNSEARLDALLEKIEQKGFQSLTSKEKKWLQEASRNIK